MKFKKEAEFENYFRHIIASQITVKYVMGLVRQSLERQLGNEGAA